MAEKGPINPSKLKEYKLQDLRGVVYERGSVVVRRAHIEALRFVEMGSEIETETQEILVEGLDKKGVREMYATIDN